jgi:protein subunit release factor B
MGSQKSHAKKELLFSITKKDFKIQTFRAGGKGGQHQNKTDSGVRIIHEESGARGECRNFRHQHQNKKEALKRLTESKKFKLWLNRKALEVIEGKRLEEKVEEMMSPENLKVEVRDDQNKWTENVLK